VEPQEERILFASSCPSTFTSSMDVFVISI